MKKSKKELEYEEASSEYAKERERKLAGNYIRAEVIVEEGSSDVSSVVDGQGVGILETAMLIRSLTNLLENFGSQNPIALQMAFSMDADTEHVKHIRVEED